MFPFLLTDCLLHGDSTGIALQLAQSLTKHHVSGQCDCRYDRYDRYGCRYDDTTVVTTVRVVAADPRARRRVARALSISHLLFLWLTWVMDARLGYVELFQRVVVAAASHSMAMLEVIEGIRRLTPLISGRKTSYLENTSEFIGPPRRPPSTVYMNVSASLLDDLNVLTHPKRTMSVNQTAVPRSTKARLIWYARTAQLVQTCEEVSQSQRKPTTYSPAGKVAGTRTSSSMAVLRPI